MSYILEALKKSDSARKRGEVPSLNDPPPPVLPSSPGYVMPWVWVGGSAALLLTATALTAFWVWRPTATPQTKNITKQVSTPPVVARKLTPIIKPPVVTPIIKPPVVAQKLTPIVKPVVQGIPQKGLSPKVKPTLNSKPDMLRRRPKPQPLPTLKNAKAYVARAWNNLNKGLYAQALADLDRATALDPGYAEAWFARGWVHEKIGAEPSAIQDYTRAIDAKPDYAAALFSRGYLRLYHNDASGAVMDFVRTQGVAKNQSLRNYSRLWLYVSRAQAGQNAKAGLTSDIQSVNLAPWPGPLISLILGRTNEAFVLNAIETVSKKSKTTRKERRVTGYYFLAMFNLLSGKRNRARTYFEKTLATGAVDFRQYDAAKRELNAMRTAKGSGRTAGRTAKGSGVK